MRARFTEAELAAAVERVQRGEKIMTVVASSNVSRRTIKRRLAEIKAGMPRQFARRGPQPLLPEVCEEDLVTWIAAMQRAKLPVQPWEVMAAANDLNRAVNGATRTATPLTHGWYARFMARHPELSLRTSQPLSRARTVTGAAVYRSLVHRVVKAVIELKLDYTRVFNADEASFVSKYQSKPVVAVRGSSSVWTRVPETLFHLSVVACVSAAGYAVPRLFILPGQRVSRASLDGCTINAAGVVTAAKGFVNGKIFELWIDHFADNVPASIARPLLLICDGCSSHKSSAVLARCEQRQVLLQVLPPNATHVVQPLDVAVFRGYKHEVAMTLRRLLRASSSHSLSRKEALAVASAAYTSKIANNTRAAVSGFRTCGLFPPSLPAMAARVAKSATGSLARSELGAARWLQVRDEACASILALPPSPPRRRGARKTIDASQKIVRREDMES